MVSKTLGTSLLVFFCPEPLTRQMAEIEATWSEEYLVCEGNPGHPAGLAAPNPIVVLSSLEALPGEVSTSVLVPLLRAREVALAAAACSHLRDTLTLAASTIAARERYSYTKGTHTAPSLEC